MQFLKIVFSCVAAAVLYGLIHDQITIRICPQYFTVFHPQIVTTDNLTLIALAWGVVATWWMGAGVGLMLAISARAGSRPKQTWEQLAPSVAMLLGIMFLCAFAFGLAGYLKGLPEWMAYDLPSPMVHRFAADWWAHSASYATGFFGGIVLCVITFARRSKLTTEN